MTRSHEPFLIDFRFVNLAEQMEYVTTIYVAVTLGHVA